jgi:acyl carrier protein
MAMTYDEVFEKMKTVLVDVLAVDDADVTPQAKLSEDLGAESIDYLDISFNLEKTFGIKVPKDDLVPMNLLANPEYVLNGRVTPKGITELKAKMPFADLSGFEADPDVTKFTNVFTVDTLVKFVMTKVN